MGFQISKGYNGWEVRDDTTGQVLASNLASEAAARSFASGVEVPPADVPPAPEEQDEPVQDELELDDMTVAQLRAKASEMGIEVSSSALKADIIDAIEAASE